MCALNYLNELIWHDENGNLAETGDEAIELVQRMVPKINISIIKFLLEKGVDPNIEDDLGYRYLKIADVIFRSDIFKLLLEYNSEIDFFADGNQKFSDWIKDELNEF
jgi:ankyrin repeat protein